jgi:hypothetical protein
MERLLWCRDGVECDFALIATHTKFWVPERRFGELLLPMEGLAVGTHDSHGPTVMVGSRVYIWLACGHEQVTSLHLIWKHRFRQGEEF